MGVRGKEKLASRLRRPLDFSPQKTESFITVGKLLLFHITCIHLGAKTKAMGESNIQMCVKQHGIIVSTRPVSDTPSYTPSSHKNPLAQQAVAAY